MLAAQPNDKAACSRCGAARSAERERLAALRRSGLLRRDASHHLDRLTELASELIDAPVALISMVDENRQFFASQRGLAEPWASAGETPLSHSICQVVVGHDAPFVLDDAGARADYANHPARHDLDVEAYCGVPIRDPNGHVLGSFCVIDNKRRAWGPDAVSVLTKLAALVTESVATTHDLAALAADLQARLLPTELPDHPAGMLEARYRPVPHTDEIGGDFYDVRPRDDGGLDLVIGDVVGHGVQSTQAASQLRAAARAVLSGSDHSPADVVNLVADACIDLPGCDCAALLVARVSPDGRRVAWARSGAMPPVLTGSTPSVVEAGASPPLGVGSCRDDPACRIELDPGQSVLFYTDGLVEWPGKRLDDGFRQLIGACRAQPDIDDIIDAVRPPSEQSDDIALMRWTASPGPA